MPDGTMRLHYQAATAKACSRARANAQAALPESAHGIHADRLRTNQLKGPTS